MGKHSPSENLIPQSILDVRCTTFSEFPWRTTTGREREKENLFGSTFSEINSAHAPDRNRGHNLTLTKAISSDRRDLQARGGREEKCEEDVFVPRRREYLLQSILLADTISGSENDVYRDVRQVP